MAGISTRRLLTNEDVERFIEDGYLIVRNCFDPKAYWHWVEESLAKADMKIDDESTWPDEEVGHFQTPNAGYEAECKDMAPKLWDAICDLVGGEERILQPLKLRSAFTCNFNYRASQEWVPPGTQAKRWHKDGATYRQFLDSPEFTLLPLMYWTDAEHQGGATFCSPGSVKYVVTQLNKHREGLNKIGAAEDATTYRNGFEEWGRFEELVCNAGDAVIMHAFLMHTISYNIKKSPRVMGRCTPRLLGPLNFNRLDGDYAPIEQIVLRKLGVDHLDYEPMGPRMWKNATTGKWEVHDGVVGR